MAGPALPQAVAPWLTFWRRSIQARVVVSTVLLSALVFTGVGWLLLQQTRDGLLEQRRKVVVAEASAETDAARRQLSAVSPTNVDAAGQRSELFKSVEDRSRVRGFDVVLVGPAGEVQEGVLDQTYSTSGLSLQESLPSAMLQHFETSPKTAWSYTTISRAGQPDVPGIVVGSRIKLPADDDPSTLYFLFPLDDEQQTLALVTRAMLTAGGLLLVLVAVLTWLVTRQVVTPVRMARRVAERLAAGQLQERLRVRGEDDLARLATSFNQMASNLQRQIRLLEELSRVQRRFVSDVSHELRTPLTTVRMASDLLHDARQDFDPATARAAELLQTELDRFEGLLADLLEISRFDAGAAALETEDVDLADVARRVAAASRMLAEQRHTRILIEAPEEPCLAEADVRRVERIVRNLVTNAIDHAESRDIVVRVARDDQAAAIAVRDYGVGLAPGESAMVFNRFWRADPARARTSGGTGLGLSIAMEDAHLHGGWLQAWGTPGGGSQFRLTLPRRAGEELRHSPLPLVPEDSEVTV